MASYELPLVRIYQQLESVSPSLASPTLPACIIGRCYQVMTYADNKLDIFTGEYDKTNGNEFTIPNALAGVKLDSSSVALYFDNMYIELTEGTFNSVINEAKITDLSTDFTTQGITIGDKVVINHASLLAPIEALVLGISATVLTISKNFTTTMTGATYSVQKKMSDKLIASSAYVVSDETISVSPALTYSYLSVARAIISADMYVAYRALRTDLSTSIGEISTTDGIISALGPIVKENPLAYGVNKAMLNTITSIKYFAVNTLEGDELGWSRAKDILSNSTSVYSLGLLTNTASVVALFKTHVEAMSVAEEHGWRVCLAGVELPVTKDLVSEQTSGSTFDLSGTIYLRDNSQTFLTAVASGDILDITFPSAITGSYTIDTVINDNVIAVTTDSPILSVESPVTYSISRTLTKDQQADEIAATIESYNSKRVFLMWPDSFYSEGELVDGFYLGAIVAGMVSGLPPHQGLTNLGVAGVDELVHSNTYFNKEQLNKIAAAGGFIFVQETPSALPYVRHQLSTDMSSVETRELSFTKNFDHLSYYFFDVLTPFIGQWNITDKTIGTIKETIRLAAEAKVKAELPKIGAPLKGFSVDTKQSPTSSDRILAISKLDLPKPLNGIDFYLYV